MASPLVFIFATVTINFSQTSRARSFVEHQKTTFYHSFTLQVPALHRNNAKTFSESTFLHSKEFFFSLRLSFRFSILRSTTERTVYLQPACGAELECAPTLETILVLLAELGFSPALNTLLFCYIFSSSACLLHKYSLFAYALPASLSVCLKSAFHPTFCPTISLVLITRPHIF